MPVIIASSVKEAKALINGGKYREIILNFDIDADDFFSLASHSAGTKISIADRKRSLSGRISKIINPRGTSMWLFIGTFALAFLAALMLVWLDDRIAETD
ncbi:Uncharacterised protein [Klebsiella pneumoniae]|uniref:Uncharacterized protein n=1 Tax=Klebsiella pneumoniae TaxID=573 RepID=A0A3S4GEB5_KLEPN|nr:Uncharacterised protein [Klebsiella pneumoniae]